jgi:hypothetical protein
VVRVAAAEHVKQTNYLIAATAREHSSGCAQCLLIQHSLTSTSVGKFGLTRQRIARIAIELGIDGWQRQCERMPPRQR